MSPQPLKVVVGITGGIAAYKSVGLIRSLVLAGHEVTAVPTDAALRFVGRPTLEAISRNPVLSDVFDDVAQVRHVALGQAADLIIVAPATANSIAKLATGLADDLLGTTVLASRAPLVIAPAMHTEMWEHPATAANIATLRERGVVVVGPGEGRLTGDDSGPGRMAEPEDILRAALATVETAGRRDLAGKRVVITAGGTREPLDPVRFIGNRSSGRQGVALAEAAAVRGASVTLIAAHLETPLPAGSARGISVVHAGSASELAEAVAEAARDAEAVIMAAAVADYRPESVAEAKIKKRDHGETLALSLVRNPDILAGLVAARPPGQLVIGFAAETETDRDRLLAVGREKAAAKGCDYLVVNTVGWTRGFGSERNEIVVIDRNGDIVIEAAGTKSLVAGRILDLVADSLAG